MGTEKSDEHVMRIFITTCKPMWRVEKALEYSIMKYCSKPYEVIFLRSGDREWQTNVDLGLLYRDQAAIKKAGCWNVGRDHPRPYSGDGWQTPFSCFRFAIPELCGFKGRAFHMDADFLVLKDLRSIFEMKMAAPILSPHQRTDFMLIDCAKFSELTLMGLWPSLSEMRASGRLIQSYIKMLQQQRFIADGDPLWESWDGQGLCKDTFTIHYTDMNMQPWKPYPEYFAYPPHTSQKAVSLFWEHYAEALEAEARGEVTLQALDPTEASQTPLKLSKA